MNKVFLSGRLGQDPEIRNLNSGGVVANLTLATSETWKDKQTGEKKEATEWHNIVMYGKPAEIASKYLKKGSEMTTINAKLKTRKWEDKEGNNRYTTEVIVDQFKMHGSGNSSAVVSNNNNSSNQEDDDLPF